jgi:hypothetical protein
MTSEHRSNPVDADESGTTKGSAVEGDTNLKAPPKQFPDIPLWSQAHVPFSKKRPYLFWLVTFAFATVVSAAATRGDPQPVRYFVLCLTLNVGAFLAVPIALWFSHRSFLSWARSVDSFVKISETDLITWYSDANRFFECSRGLMFTGLGFGIVAVIAYQHDHYLTGATPYESVWATIVVLSAGAMAGGGLSVMFRGALVIVRLGVKFRDSIVLSTSRFGILSTGRMLAQCWFVIGIAWLIYTLTALMRPIDDPSEPFFLRWPVLLLAVPTLPLIIGAFVGSQIPLHTAMVLCKGATIRRVSELTQNRRDAITFLQKQRAEAEALPEWPFSSKAFASVGGSGITAALPIVLKALPTALKMWFPNLSLLPHASALVYWTLSLRST